MKAEIARMQVAFASLTFILWVLQADGKGYQEFSQHSRIHFVSFCPAFCWCLRSQAMARISFCLMHIYKCYWKSLSFMYQGLLQWQQKWYIDPAKQWDITCKCFLHSPDQDGAFLLQMSPSFTLSSLVACAAFACKCKKRIRQDMSKYRNTLF